MSTIGTRILGFTSKDPSTRKNLASMLNKLPAFAPVIGIGALGSGNK